MPDHLVPNLRYIGCPCYWNSETKTLAWEDRDRLIEMHLLASEAFGRLLERGRCLTEITNEEMGREIRRATEPVR